jgi:hypothetical protein
MAHKQAMIASEGKRNMSGSWQQEHEKKKKKKRE